MNDRLLIETEKIGDYRIKIYYDEWAECPCTAWDMVACYLFEYSDFKHLHDKCNYKDLFYDNKHSLEDAIRRLAAENVEQKDMVKFLKSGGSSEVRLAYNRSDRQWELQTRWGWNGKETWDWQYQFAPSELQNCDLRDELVEHLDKEDLLKLIEEYADELVVKEWSSRGYSQGDYVEGIAYMTKKRYDEMVGNTDKPWREHAQHLIDLELKEVEIWMWGDCKGYILEKKVPFRKVYDDDDQDDEEAVEWEEEYSCWGFYMDTEELIEEVIAEHGLKEAIAI